MRCRAHFGPARSRALAAFALALLTACGGGDDWPAPPATSIRYVLEYALPQSWVYPNGTITVSPLPGRLTISDDGPVRVQLELAGFPTQQLDRPNFEPKDDPQLKYVFGLPQALAPETHACVAAKVTVTAVSGEVSMFSFPVCAGIGIGLEASRLTVAPGWRQAIPAGQSASHRSACALIDLASAAGLRAGLAA